ncbi:hypothetical protein [Senegalimassilia anaerobia]|uniref:hypothetical protein n=1 Tax=Senegalimassilia anaerobia TaxID=1473216 RepID=UPI0026EA1AA2|nr:hypothetical protein [Senegalimassilia anaerobia]
MKADISHQKALVAVSFRGPADEQGTEVCSGRQFHFPNIHPEHTSTPCSPFSLPFSFFVSKSD